MPAKDDKERKKRRLRFIKQKKTEFGQKIIDEFIDFATTLNREAFIEENGVAILKPQFRSN